MTFSAEGFVCPHCRGVVFHEHDNGLICDNCDRLAFRAMPDCGLLRVDREWFEFRPDHSG